ncbi:MULTISPECIES: hypothetical protein [Methylobacterium]|uniref:Uncharacterized protein n=1 Tax=Methylobacterium bullatum TaxID=570505 RepID=A0AAV4Z5E9_9HYPH|nr:MULTISPECIES: hypothetical protein [Methylobacterium]MBD8902213.1 hypothetical protein [Methylobacterium bullatum]TXN28837.1 hypothetical protein FV220_07890 [Methylobacterium sp. WL19]GJD38982.1 hypothetical protein OICFNHDK_1434 [Methylobacterium bullatum]
MPPTWHPMHTAPQIVERIWLNHLTLGPILAEGRPGRWYAPSAARQVWRWYRPVGPDTLEPFAGWLPYAALAAEEKDAAALDDPSHGLSDSLPVAGQQGRTASFGG